MPLMLNPQSRIEYALNLSSDVLLKLLEAPEFRTHPNTPALAVNMAVAMVLAFEQSELMTHGGQHDYERAAN